MPTTTQTHRPDFTATAGPAARRTPLLLRMLNWLAARDAAYRSACKLRGLPDHRLDDIGLTREQAETAFRTGR